MTTEVTLGKVGEETSRMADVVIDPPPSFEAGKGGSVDVVVLPSNSSNPSNPSNPPPFSSHSSSSQMDATRSLGQDMRGFVDVEEIELPTLRWTEWWPSAARKIVLAIEADKKTRKEAVESLLLGLDTFKETDATPLTTESHAMRVVYSSEAKRIRALEDWMKTMTEAWCSAIRKCAVRCEEEKARREERKRKVEEKAERMKEEASSLLFRGRILTDGQKREILSLIDDERDVFSSLGEKDLSLTLKGIRMECASGVSLPPPPCMSSFLSSSSSSSSSSSLDKGKEKGSLIGKADVCQALSSLTPFEREYVKRLVASQIQNLEHDCAKRVSVQCETEWMRALR